MSGYEPDTPRGLQGWGVVRGVGTQRPPKRPGCCPLAPGKCGSAAGIEEGGPRLSASLRPGDPLPRPTHHRCLWRGQMQSDEPERAGSSKLMTETRQEIERLRRTKTPCEVAVPAGEKIAAGAMVYLDGRKRCGMVVRGREGETTTTRQCPANETLGNVAWALVDARFRLKGSVSAQRRRGIAPRRGCRTNRGVRPSRLRHFRAWL